jgi:hypothetical protein
VVLLWQSCGYCCGKAVLYLNKAGKQAKFLLPIGNSLIFVSKPAKSQFFHFSFGWVKPG